MLRCFIKSLPDGSLELFCGWNNFYPLKETSLLSLPSEASNTPVLFLSDGGTLGIAFRGCSRRGKVRKSGTVG